MYRKLLLLAAAAAMTASPASASAGRPTLQRDASGEVVRSGEQVEGNGLYGGNRMLYVFLAVTIVAVILALTLRGGDEDPASP